MSRGHRVYIVLMHYLYLTIAIFSEVIATTALKSSQSFTRLVPSLIVVAGYGAAFYFLALCLKKINIGAAYAIWSGVGIVLITILGSLIHKEVIDRPGMLGMALIIAGVVVLNLFSDSVVH